MSGVDIRQAVRKRPGMYVGDVHDGSGLRHLVWELVANSVDEHLAGRATRVRVSADGDVAEVEDDGGGIPVEVESASGMPFVERVLTRYHDAPTSDGHSPHVHHYHHGMGLAVVNAVCAPFEVDIWRDGVAWSQRYVQGIPEGPLVRKGPTDRRGTKIRFRADPKIFSSAWFESHRLREGLWQIASFNPGLAIAFGSKEIRVPDGTRDWIHRMAFKHSVEPPPEIFVSRGTEGGVIVDVALGWADFDETELRSFANQHDTNEGGSHVLGLWQGLSQVVEVRDARGSHSADLARRRLGNGLLAFVHVLILDPKIGGPTHGRLDNTEARDAVRDHVAKTFSDYLEHHPELAGAFERVSLAARS